MTIPPDVKVAIVGSRKFPFHVGVGLVRRIVAAMPPTATVVSGGCKEGADAWAKRAAEDFGLAYMEFPPDTQGGKLSFGQACARRNQAIVDACDRLVALYDGSSPGTKMTLGFARKAGKPVKVYGPDGRKVE